MYGHRFDDSVRSGDPVVYGLECSDLPQQWRRRGFADRTMFATAERRIAGCCFIGEASRSAAYQPRL